MIYRGLRVKQIRRLKSGVVSFLLNGYKDNNKKTLVYFLSSNNDRFTRKI